MNRTPLNPITGKDIETFERDGVVCLRGQFDADWIKRMRTACIAHGADPSDHMNRWWGKESGMPSGAALAFMAQTQPDFRDFMRESPLAQIAATFLRVNSVRYWYDQLFIKEPAREEDLDKIDDLQRGRTYWHNDLPFWPLRGEHIVSIWVPFTDVTKEESGLEYIAASHKQGKMYRPFLMPPDAPGAEGLDPCPDFDKRRDDPDIRFLSWDMQAGDCLIHHPLTVHGSSANRGKTLRVALSTRYLGVDVRYEPVPFPKWFPQEPDVVPGAYPDDDKYFPVIWSRP